MATVVSLSIVRFPKIASKSQYSLCASRRQLMHVLDVDREQVIFEEASGLMAEAIIGTMK